MSRKIVLWIVVGNVTMLVGLIALKAAIYVTAHKHQREAQRLLSAISSLQIGVSTVDDLKRKIFPMSEQFRSGCDGVDQGAYAVIYNGPSWKLLYNDHTPKWIREMERK